MVRVSLRTVTLNVPPQDVITRDNVTARVDAVVYFRVVDPNCAVVQVESFLKATSQIAQTTLRSVLGKADLDTLLSEREELNEELQKIIDEQTEPWGVKVTTVEIKDVGIPQAMQHAMARQAQAERERRAKVINAEGEFQAAARLSEAADVISQNPTTLQLRYLQTLSEIGVNQNTTIVFPLPIDLIKPLLEATADVGAGIGAGGAAARERDSSARRRARVRAGCSTACLQLTRTTRSSRLAVRRASSVRARSWSWAWAPSASMIRPRCGQRKSGTYSPRGCVDVGVLEAGLVGSGRGPCPRGRCAWARCPRRSARSARLLRSCELLGGDEPLEVGLVGRLCAAV